MTGLELLDSGFLHLLSLLLILGVFYHSMKLQYKEESSLCTTAVPLQCASYKYLCRAIMVFVIEV